MAYLAGWLCEGVRDLDILSKPAFLNICPPLYHFAWCTYWKNHWKLLVIMLSQVTSELGDKMQHIKHQQEAQGRHKCFFEYVKDCCIASQSESSTAVCCVLLLILVLSARDMRVPQLSPDTILGTVQLVENTGLNRKM